MSKKKYLRQAVAAAFFAASGASSLAFAVEEVEPNDTIDTPQGVVVGSGPTDRGRVEVTGVIGSRLMSEPLVADVDFYSFEGKAGDLLTVNIDNGVKASTTLRSVDTILAVFGPLPSKVVLRQMNDGMPIDFPGSASSQDARIDNLFLPSDGTYIIGVSSHPRLFANDGKLTRTDLPPRANGAYTMIISGVTPPPPPAPQVQHMNIEIKPGSGEFAPINPKAQGNIPVALLSSDKFDALKVDRTSLTFGRTGDENSMRRCSKEGSYVNADNLLDLVCHFDNQSAKFEADTLEGIVKGKTEDGRLFEGRATLKVVPAKD